MTSTSSRTVPAPAPAPSARPRSPEGRVRPAVLLAIGIGGALGSVARYELALAVPPSSGGFPWATWIVNVTGSLVLAVLVTLVVERWPPTRYVRPFAGIGVCGGYTTWSTFMTESALLVRDHHVAMAIAYLVATLAGGLAAAVAGVRLARLGPATVAEVGEP